jgi:hypothetical protein
VEVAAKPSMEEDLSAPTTPPYGLDGRRRVMESCEALRLRILGFKSVVPSSKWCDPSRGGWLHWRAKEARVFQSAFATTPTGSDPTTYSRCSHCA